jgi:hypothetical protein
VLDPGQAHHSSADGVRAAVASAAARRRDQDVWRRLWRVAPAAALVALAAAAASRWLGASIIVSLVPVAVVLLAFVAHVYVLGRKRTISDALAARLDDEGGFRGELRSAYWFASRGAGDEWTGLHLDRAAARLGPIDWNERYPAIRATAARLATAGLLVAAVGAAIGVHGRMSAPRRALSTPVAAATADAAAQPPAQMQMLPPDLLKQLEELLANAEQGKKAVPQTDKAIDIWNMFAALNSDIDPDKLKELAKAMDPTKRANAQQAAKKLNEMAGRSLKAADVNELPADMRQALEDLGMQLSQAADAEQRAASDSAKNASASTDGPANQASADAPPSLDQASFQMAKESNAAAGAGMMMMAPQLGPRGNPSQGGFGGGGNSGPPPNNGSLAALTQALRKETVEASADTAGENVLSETRRKTEHGQATVGFTRGDAVGAGPSRASAPPPVPEDRRGTVQTYFTRTQ